VVTPVARPFVPLPTPAVNSADVDNEAMAAIGKGVVVEASCVVLEVVASNLKKNLSPLFCFFNLHYKNIKMIRNSKSLLQQTEP
jgi:hypothetical protein